MAQNFLSDIQLGDNTYIRLGSATDGDLRIYHDGTHTYLHNVADGTGVDEGDLIIQQDKVNGDIIFKNDDQSGGLATYFVINGGTGETEFERNIKLKDDVFLELGNAADGYLRYKSADNIIDFWAPAGMEMVTNATIKIRTGADETIATFTQNDSVDLYYDNSKKFETTSAGVTVTGAVTASSLDISGDVDIAGELNFQKTGTTTITGSSNTFNINFATETNNYQFTLDNAACTIAFANLTNVVGKSGNIIITNPSSVGSLSVGNLPSEAYSPGGATINWDTNASSVSILSYFILASDKVLINYVGNFKSYGT